MSVRLLESGRVEVENQYGRAVRPKEIRGAERIVRSFRSSARERGGGSARFPRAGCACGKITAIRAQWRFKSKCRPCRESQRMHRGLVLQGQEAFRLSGFRSDARRNILSARPWFRRKARAQRTFTMRKPMNWHSIVSILLDDTLPPAASRWHMAAAAGCRSAYRERVSAAFSNPLLCSRGTMAPSSRRRCGSGMIDRLVRGPPADFPRRHDRRSRSQRHSQRSRHVRRAATLFQWRLRSRRRARDGDVCAPLSRP